VPCRDPDFASALLDSLRSGLLAVDAGGVVTALSLEGARILGLEPPEPAPWLGRDLGDALAEHPRLAALLREALGGQELPSRAELVLDRAAWEVPRTIGFTLITVRRGGGAVAGAAVLFRDLTPIERRGEQDRLRDRLAALGQMVAGLAHEIRNPLATIGVLAGLLERALADRPDEQKLVGELLEELRGLTRTVNARLDFVRPSSPCRVPVDLAALVEEALRLARARTPFAGRVDVAVEDGASPVAADPEQLRSVLVNLVLNAFEAMAEAPGADEPRLAIRISSAGGEGVTIAVSDNGPGVPPALRERIFYPFFTTRADGTGVGLAEAQKAVLNHGGSLGVRDGEGGGATFVIHLPAAGPAA
jgi:signal transduction histidine kinase